MAFLDHEAFVATHKVLVVGATGGTGRDVVRCAVARGLHVSVLCRDPSRLPPPITGGQICMGDITTDVAPLAAAMQGQDAVIDPQAALRAHFGAMLTGPVAELVVRH